MVAAPTVLSHLLLSSRSEPGRSVPYRVPKSALFIRAAHKGPW